MARRARREGLIERVVVPAVSAVVVATAALHTLTDGRRRPGRQAPPPPPEPGRRGPLDRITARLPWLKPVLAVQKRFGEIGGNQLAAAFTFSAFLSLFPLLLLGVAVVGFVQAGTETDFAGRLVDQLGLTGQAAELVTDSIARAEATRGAATAVGLLGLLWAGLGLVGALQYTYNAVWQVKGRGLRDKLFGLIWLLGATVLFLAGAAITTALRWVPGFLAPAGLLVGAGVSFALWLWSSRVLPNRKLAWRYLVPGAVVGAVGLEILKAVGAYWVPRAVADASALWGSLGIVFAVLAWLAFFGQLIVYSAVTNVVAYERRFGTVSAVVTAPAVDAALPGQEGPLVANRSGRLVTIS